MTIHEIDNLVDNVENRIMLDKDAYTWTDKLYVTIVAPEHNLDDNRIEEIGNSDEHPVKISIRSFDLDNYKLAETDPDTGIFTGEVTLTGNPYHDANGDGDEGDASGLSNAGMEGLGPNDGLLPIHNRETGITVSFEFAEDKVAIVSVPITWNKATVQWTEPEYSIGNTGNITVTDPDINLNQEEKDTITIDVWSDSDAGGVDIVLTETDVATGVFKGAVLFTYQESSGQQLKVTQGDTVWAEYEDNTLPEPYTTADEIDISGTTVIEN